MKKEKLFWILLSLYELFNKDLRINYVPESRKGCYIWEQAFRRNCVVRMLTDRTTRRSSESMSHLNQLEKILL